MRRAGELVEAKDYQAAEELLDRLVVDNPPDQEAAGLLDTIKAERRRAESEKAYREALEEAERQRCAGNYDEAQQILREAVTQALDRRAGEMLQTVIAERVQAERQQKLEHGKQEIRAWLDRNAFESALTAIDKFQEDFAADGELGQLREAAERQQEISEVLARIFSAGNTLPVGTAAGGTTGATTQPLTSVTLGAQLQALQQKGQAKILAQPRILAADNRIAAILSGEAVPIFNNVLVPSGGTTLIQQQIQYINVGVSLEILPRISADGNVTVDVFSEVSNIVSYIGTTPQIAVRQELTTASAGDGQSILMGGLMQDQEIKTLSKIPGIGDLPIIGPLFQQTISSSQKTNLYLVITPHILTKTSTADRPPTTPP